MCVLIGSSTQLGKVFAYFFVRIIKGLAKPCSAAWRGRFEVEGSVWRLLVASSSHVLEQHGGRNGRGKAWLPAASRQGISEQGVKQKKRVNDAFKMGERKKPHPPNPHTTKAFVGTSASTFAPQNEATACKSQKTRQV